MRSGQEPHTAEGTMVHADTAPVSEGSSVELHFRGGSLRGLVDAGEELVFAFHFDNQVNGKLINDGVNSAHYTGEFVYADLVSTSCWHDMVD